MERESINNTNSFRLNIVSVSVEKEDTDTILITMKDDEGDKIKLFIDNVGGNGFRIAMASLMDVPPLVLPLDKGGDYQCHFIKCKIEEPDGNLIFEKNNGETEPLGKYIDIEDGMITFREGDLLWSAIKIEDYIVSTIPDIYDYLVFTFEKELLDEKFRVKLDKIYPFNRFGKINKLSYGYFHSSE